MKPLSPMASRVIALILLIGVIAVPYVFVVEPLVAKHQQYGETIAQYQDQLQRYRRIAADYPQL